MTSEIKVVIFSEDVAKSKELFSSVEREEWSIKYNPLDEMNSILPMENADCVVLHLYGGSDRSEKDYIFDIHNIDDNIPVIILSEHGKIEDAVSVMREGAYDYYTELDPEKFVISVINAVRLYRLTKRVFLLEQQTGWQSGFDEIIGYSPKMQEIFQLISSVAKSNATVLILGESGTGKEMVAKSIHRHSKRRNKPFVDINCGAIPRELLENELFGHEKGSYTGADKRYIGSCERADGGTLFLDEICEMDPSLQVKILRLLQERTFYRVGGVEQISVDIRFIAATNKDIEKEVKEGRFREDLYYRLNVVPINIPPLRDRKEDIVLLARHFLEKYGTKNEKMFVDVASDAAEAMAQYSWPGNVRELENVIERVVVLNNDSKVRFKHLPPNIQEAANARKTRSASAEGYIPSPQKILPLELVEKYAIESALEKCGWNVAEAAEKLKIGQATIYRKIKHYGLKSK